MKSLCQMTQGFKANETDNFFCEGHKFWKCQYLSQHRLHLGMVISCKAPRTVDHVPSSYFYDISPAKLLNPVTILVHVLEIIPTNQSCSSSLQMKRFCTSSFIGLWSHDLFAH